MKPVLRYALVVIGALVSISMFLLASASDNSGFFDRYFAWLLGLNAAVTAALLVLVLVSLGRLYLQFKAGKFGSKLRTRLVLLFAGVGILPGLVIFLVSLRFVSHSIDSWFDVRIETALQSGLNLGIAALDDAVAKLHAVANDSAESLARLEPGQTQVVLERLLHEQEGLQNAMILAADGTLISSATKISPARMKFDLPEPDMLIQASTSAGYARPEGGLESDEADGQPRPRVSDELGTVTGLRVRVLLRIPARLGVSPRYLQLLQSVPLNLASNAEVLGVAYREYKERNVARTGLRKMYLTTLTLTLLLAMFGAIASAFLIAAKLAEPLLVLAEGTRAVAEGDLSPRPIVATNDELGTLTQSFNMMTRQLFDARSAVEKNRSALQNAKARLESVLENMSAGVVVLDAEFRLVTVNEAVNRILRQDLAPHIGHALTSIDGLENFGLALKRSFSAQSAHSAAGAKVRERDHWQKQLEIPRPEHGGDEHDLTLLARGSRLPVESGSGYIVVFDDISDVISAQRSIAWGEVARRLAHEIKNPLTPIQLSAERMQMKLESKLAPADAELLARGTTTIVNQVAAMKRMVDDFRDYARTPPAQLQRLDLNHLIEEILHLYLDGDEGDMIHAALAPNLPAVMGDPTQMRQVIHNLLQNAQDALAERPSGAQPARIDVSTEAVHFRHADGSEGTAVRLAIADNGPGFAPKILARAFEPYVTSKVRGTGLGLPMVKKIIEEHGGRIDIVNREDATGASVLILLLKLAPAEQGQADSGGYSTGSEQAGGQS